MKFSEKIIKKSTPAKSSCSVKKIVKEDKKDEKKKKAVKPWFIKTK